MICCLLLAGTAAPTPAQPPVPSATALSPEPEPAATAVAAIDSFLALPDAVRVERTAKGARCLAQWERFVETERQRYADDGAPIADATGHVAFPAGRPQIDLAADGTPAAFAWLVRATTLNPCDVRAWLELARLGLETADAPLTRRALAAAGHALALPNAPGGDSRRRLEVALAQVRGWWLRDQAQWSEGLACVEAGLRHAPADLELLLLRGLLLAGAGRFAEANRCASALPPIEYRVYGWMQTGLRVARSGYGARWIRAMACVAIGEPRLAYHVLGARYESRLDLPYGRHYWNDVGLVCELDDRPDEAGLAYALGLIATPYFRFGGWSGFCQPARVCGQPNERVPAYVSRAGGLLAGSLFVHGARLAREAEAASDTTAARLTGAAADSALTQCLRWNIRPAHALALRGRLRAALDRDDPAQADLEQAHRELAALGLRDARTSLLLGIRQLGEGHRAPAIGLLREATQADSTMAVTWRVLGAALAQVGELVEARAALDRAIGLEPQSAIGWYNRGLLGLAQQQWEPAAADLRTAAALAPDDPQIAAALARALGRIPDASAPSPPGGAATVEAPQGPRDARDAVTRSPGPPRLRVTSLERGSAAAQRAALPGRPAIAAGLDTAAAARLPELQAAYDREPTPRHRAELAGACLQAAQSSRALSLLLPHWGKDLSSGEICLVLEIDRGSGDSARVAGLLSGLDPERPVPADADVWALVAVICGEQGRPRDGLRALAAARTLDPDNAGLRMYEQMLDAQCDGLPESSGTGR